MFSHEFLHMIWDKLARTVLTSNNTCTGGREEVGEGETGSSRVAANGITEHVMSRNFSFGCLCAAYTAQVHW